jgi:preprotein translocase subunit SecF
VRALIVFLIVIALYMSWRLEWKMAGAALFALFHDLVFTAGIYALVGLEVTPATVIAILTILGYSLYDTVVVFDKMRENVKERGDRHTYGAIVNMSMNQVLMRSINTSLVTLLPIGSLLFVGSFLLGATTLREFALALFVGVATGTYSSIFLAAPLVGMWKEREDHWIKVRRRLERRGAEEFAPHQVAPAGVPGAVPRSGAIPRPPRNRQRRR